MVTKKSIISLAKEVDNDKAYWDKLEREQEKMLTTEWLKQTIEDAMDDRIGSPLAEQLTAVFLSSGLMAGDKLFITFLLTQHHIGISEVSLQALILGTGYSKKGCGDVTRRLIAMGYIQRTRQGWYRANIKRINKTKSII